MSVLAADFACVDLVWPVAGFFAGTTVLAEIPVDFSALSFADVFALGVAFLLIGAADESITVLGANVDGSAFFARTSSGGFTPFSVESLDEASVIGMEAGLVITGDTSLAGVFAASLSSVIFEPYACANQVVGDVERN